MINNSRSAYCTVLNLSLKVQSASNAVKQLALHQAVQGDDAQNQGQISQCVTNKILKSIWDEDRLSLLLDKMRRDVFLLCNHGLAAAGGVPVDLRTEVCFVCVFQWSSLSSESRHCFVRYSRVYS